MNVVEEITKYAKHALTPERFRHVTGVASSITELARIHGEDEVAAQTAAWLHDVAREWDKEHLLDCAQKANIDNAFQSVSELLHGPVAAYIGKTEFGITDEKILDAVYYHTTGRKGMTLLDKLLFVADAIEPTRRYPGVEKIRSLAKENLNSAVLSSIDSTITYLLQTKKPIALLTVATRNELLDELSMTSLIEKVGDRT